MKKYFLCSLILAIAFVQINAQEISTVQNSLIVKKTATWCPKCGDWGWGIFVDMIEELEEEQVVFLAAHYSGQLQTEAGQAITNNFGVAGQPNYYFNGLDQDVSSTNTADKAASIRKLIKDFSSPEANIGIGIDAVLDTQSVTANARVQFLKEMDGEFYLSLYLVEDPLTFYQAGHPNGNDAVHHKILRTHLTEDVLADKIAGGNIMKDEIFDFNFTAPLEDSWIIDNISLIAVVWEKQDGKLEFENTIEQDFSLTSPTVEISNTISSLNAMFINSNNLSVTMTSTEYNDAFVTLTSAGSGQKIFRKPVSIRAGQNKFVLSPDQAIPGMYILTIEIQNHLPQSLQLVKAE